MTTSRRNLLFGILGLGTVLRVLVILLALRHNAPSWFFDQATELGALASSLNTQHTFTSPFGPSTGPSAFLAPGYPAVIAVLFHICGSFSRSSEVALMLLQLLFLVAAGALLVRMAQRLFGSRVALLVAMLWALSPPLLFFPTIFWESSLSFLLMTSLLVAALACERQSSPRSWSVFAALIVVAFYVNPSLLPPAIAIALWIVLRTRNTPRRALLLSAAVAVLLMSLWPLRNERALHAFIPTRSNFGYELWQGNRPCSIIDGGNSCPDGFFNAALHPNHNAAERQRWSKLGELNYMREKNAIARQSIAANLSRFIKLSFKRAACFWTGVEPRGSGIIVAYTTATTLLGIAGLVLLWRRHRPLALLFSLPLLLFPLPYYITHPDFRFRAVLDPVLMLLTAYAICCASKSDDGPALKPTAS